MDVGQQFTHTMGKQLLLEAQKHIDNAFDAHDQSFYKDDETGPFPPEAADTAMTKALVANMKTHEHHNNGDYENALRGLAFTREFFRTALHHLSPTDPVHKPVRDALEVADYHLNDIGPRYVALMVKKPPKGQDG